MLVHDLSQFVSRSIQLVVASLAYLLSVNIYHFSVSRDRRLEQENQKFVIELNRACPEYV